MQVHARKVAGRTFDYQRLLFISVKVVAGVCREAWRGSHAYAKRLLVRNFTVARTI